MSYSLPAPATPVEMAVAINCNLTALWIRGGVHLSGTPLRIRLRLIGIRRELIVIDVIVVEVIVFEVIVFDLIVFEPPVHSLDVKKVTAFLLADSLRMEDRGGLSE